MDGADCELTRLTGKLSLDVFGFVTVEGDFGIESKQGEVRLAGVQDDPATTDVNEATAPVDVDMLLIGGSNLTAFVGSNGGTESAVGVELSEVAFALALQTQQLTAAQVQAKVEPRSWTSVQATAGEVSFAGVEGLKVEVTTLELQVNREASDGSVVDYALVDAKDESKGRKTELSVATGPSSSLELTMDGADGELTRLTGKLSLDVFGFVTVEGDFGIESKQGEVRLAGVQDDPATTEVNEATAPVDVDMLLIGGSNLTAFVGSNGGTESAVGVELSEVAFALALQTEQLTAAQVQAKV
jgi:hypothetical protein